MAQHKIWGSQQRCRPGRTMCWEHAHSQSALCLSWRHGFPLLDPSRSQLAAQPRRIPGQPRSLNHQSPGPLLQLPSLPSSCAWLGSTGGPSLAALYRYQWPHPGRSGSGTVMVYSIRTHETLSPQGLLLLLLPLELLVLLGLLLLLRQHMQKGSFIPSHV